MRSWIVASIALALVLGTVCGCTSVSTSSRPSRTSTSNGHSGPALASSAPSGTPSTRPRSSPPGGPGVRLRPGPGRRTRQGFWWGVDSTVAIDGASLANVRGYYRTKRDPAVWGRYLTGPYAVHRPELTFAARHHIALYVLVPDDDCSGCAGGGDRCGNDSTAAQARRDARQAVTAARRLGLPGGVALFKDIEQVGACYGELSARYLRSWYRTVHRTRFRPAFYGNSTAQNYDFPRAFCAASRLDPGFAAHLVLAQDEPEPDIGAPARTIGPRTAPRFRPHHPHCVPRSAIDIWQYGESLTDANVTDIDEIRPGTPGLLTPNGAATTGR